MFVPALPEDEDVGDVERSVEDAPLGDDRLRADVGNRPVSTSFASLEVEQVEAGVRPRDEHGVTDYRRRHRAQSRLEPPLPLARLGVERDCFVPVAGLDDDPAGPDRRRRVDADFDGFPPPDRPVRAVGIGLGSPEFLTRCGACAIREADIVVGFETVVELVRGEIAGDALTCGYRDEPAVLTRFAERVADGERGAAVLMGDSNHSGYQFLGKVEAAVGAPVEVVSGVSSLQVAAGRARTLMEETTFVTLHKSGPIEADLRRLERDVGGRHLLVLPRPFDWMPERIAHRLRAAGAPDCEALVFERLTHDDETVTRTSLSELAADVGSKEGTAFSDLSVLAVRR